MKLGNRLGGISADYQATRRAFNACRLNGETEHEIRGRRKTLKGIDSGRYESRKKAVRPIGQRPGQRPLHAARVQPVSKKSSKERSIELGRANLTQGTKDHSVDSVVTVRSATCKRMPKLSCSDKWEQRKEGKLQRKRKVEDALTPGQND
jgi:hypothetical protein